jgi:hypothetical protein
MSVGSPIKWQVTANGRASLLEGYYPSPSGVGRNLNKSAKDADCDPA